MLSNIVPYVSVLQKKDEELTEIEKQNKQLLLQNKKQDDSYNQNTLYKNNDSQYHSQNFDKQTQNKNEINTDKQINKEESENRKYNLFSKKNYIQNEKKRFDECNIQQRDSTENDYVLAQLLQLELNDSPIKEEPQKNVIKRDSKKQYNNINIPLESLLTEKDKRLLMRQNQDHEQYQKQSEEVQQIQNKYNNDNLIEVDDDFVNNILNKQYPTNKNVVEDIKNKEFEKDNKNPYQQQSIQQNTQQFFSPLIQQQNNQPQIRYSDNIQWCSLCGEYQRESQFEKHKSECRMATVLCQFCESSFPRYIIDSHMDSCLKREENKLLDLYQQIFASEGIPINKTSQIFFGSRQQLRQQYNIQNYKQQKEIERLILQNQRKIQQSYANKTSKSQYYAEIKYVKDSSSLQAEDCSICFQTFIEKETLGMLPCAHKFHTNCIDDWIKVKKLCPLCKRGF